MPDITIEWNNLQSFNGSQDGGFEELCKQLFGAECRSAGAAWIPKGTIDAGVEGYGRFVDGAEWGLQAKWFRQSPTPKQWHQVDESVGTALNRHPNLKRYVIYFPLDLSDAREPQTKTALDRWNQAKTRYETWARDAGMEVSFELRSSHDIVRELVKSENRGLRYYFFGGPDLDPGRVRRRIEDILNVVGERYSQKLNVEVPLVRYVEAMTLSERYIGRTFKYYRAVDARTGVLRTETIAARFHEECTVLLQRCRTVLEMLKPLSTDSDAQIAWDDVAEISRKATDESRDLARGVRHAGDELAGETAADHPDSERRNSYEHQVHDLWRLASALEDLGDFAESSEVQLSRTPYMLLVGEAGSGKTHFICDVGLNAVQAGNIAIILLGAKEFDGNSAWGEIARQNLLPSDHEELLGALHSAAEATGTRALLLIDGINEGPSPRYWYDNLNALVHQVKRFPRVALIVSVRDTYLDLCVRKDAREQFISIMHEGFGYRPLEAQRAFFKNFGIREPAEPLLLNEFRNPLFLLLFCKGIQAAGLSEIPRGLSGLTAIFDFFVNAQNERISEELDLDPTDRLVPRSLAALADALTAELPNAIERSKAKAIVDALHSSLVYSASVFAALERQGLIARVDTGENTYVRFTYERMADHQRAHRLLESIPAGPSARNVLRERIAGVVENTYDALHGGGLLEALTIQVPERCGIELAQLLPTVTYWDVQMLLRTLPWRRPGSVNDVTPDNVLHWLDTEEQLRADVVECLLSCALIPQHLLNADSLHTYLYALDMSRRDALWTVSISGRQHEGAAVTRLTSWARDGAFGARTSEAALATGTVLLWLCCSTNRRVRDDATKGLVALMDTVPSMSMVLFKRFRTCNDPYVVQRMYAALAGHTMRTYRPTADLKDLAHAVLEQAKGNGLPVDLLARDFARTIVERARFLGVIDVDVDVRAVRPPYGAAPPNVLHADEEFFDRYSWKHRADGGEEFPRGLLSVHFSLDMGDFARYVVGTNGRGDWLNVPISVDPPMTDRQRRDAFEASLTRRQRHLRKALNKARRASHVVMPNFMSAIREQLADLDRDRDDQWLHHISAEFAATVDGAKALKDESLAETTFLASLDEAQREQYEAAKAPEKANRHYDLTAATRWIFRRVIDLGYGGKEVYAFDDLVWRDTPRERDDGRRERIERIGKKYQWIAFFEFLARMADNFYLQRWSDEPVRYDVPLQIFTPDIDPSCLIVETRRPQFTSHAQSWWAGDAYDDWRPDLDIDGWMRETAKLPDPKSVLAVVDQQGIEWICLNTHLSWSEKEPLLHDRYEVPRRELWYLIFGYLVPKTEASRVYNALLKKNFYGGTLRPEPEEVYRLFWGDLYWSPAFAYEADTFTASHGALKNGARKKISDLLEPATGGYLRETGDDNSIADAIRIEVPIKEIVEAIGGVASDPERGAWLDATGTVVALDPSVAGDGPQAVLVRRDRLEAYLQASPYALIWTLLSEKQIIGGWSERYAGRLITSGAYWLGEEPTGLFRIVGRKTPRYKDNTQT